MGSQQQLVFGEYEPTTAKKRSEREKFFVEFKVVMVPPCRVLCL